MRLLGFLVLTFVVWVILYAVSFIDWLFEGPHIEALIASGIPLRFDDTILYAMIHLEWWALLLSIAMSVLIALSLVFGER